MGNQCHEHHHDSDHGFPTAVARHRALADHRRELRVADVFDVDRRAGRVRSLALKIAKQYVQNQEEKEEQVSV